MTSRPARWELQPHSQFGHLAIARHVVRSMQLSQVLFVPTGDPPHKQDGALAPANIRLRNGPSCNRQRLVLRLSDIEIQRKGKILLDRYGPRITTPLWPFHGAIFHHRSRRVSRLPTWREPHELLQVCHFVVVPGLDNHSRRWTEMPLLPQPDLLGAGTARLRDQDRLEITVPSCPGITCLALPPCPISASDIRQRVRNGQPLANILPPPR